MGNSYEQYKPTKRQIIVPIIIFIVAALVGGICLLVAKTLGVESERIIFTAPSSQTMMLEDLGSYTIYLATETTFEGEKYTVPEGYKGLEVKLLHNQAEVELKAPENIYEYGEEGDKYIDAYTFLVEEAGEYVLECQLKEKAVEKVVLSVGKTQENVTLILGLTMIGCMVIIMGTCQLIGYLLYNGVNYGVYYFKKTRGM